MPKQIKLTRTEHVALKKFLDPENLDLGGHTGKSIERLAMLNLLTAIPKPEVNGQASCDYRISDKGRTYLQEITEMPLLRMGEAMAQKIYSMLGDSEYDCASPFFADDSGFQKLVYDGGVEPIFVDTKAMDGTMKPKFKGYKLSSDGKDAFENTAIGTAYTERMDLLKKRDEYEAKFLEMAAAQVGDDVQFMLAKAEYYRMNGLDEFAAKLTIDANIEQQRRTVASHIEDLMQPQDKIVYSGKFKAHWRIELRLAQGFHTANVQRSYSETYSNKLNDYWQIRDSASFQADSHDERTVGNKSLAMNRVAGNRQRVIEVVELWARAIAVTDRLNEKMFGIVITEDYEDE